METSRLGGCSQSESSRFPPAHDVFDHLSLILQLLGKAFDSVTEEASLRHGSIQELHLLMLINIS